MRVRTCGHLASICRSYGIDVGDLTDVRGHRLPIRRSGATVASTPS
ncbi:MAG: hypothetical protein R2878_12375 [Thermoleophilia bacterium]